MLNEEWKLRLILFSSFKKDTKKLWGDLINSNLTKLCKLCSETWLNIHLFISVCVCVCVCACARVSYALFWIRYFNESSIRIKQIFESKNFQFMFHVCPNFGANILQKCQLLNFSLLISSYTSNETCLSFKDWLLFENDKIYNFDKLQLYEMCRASIHLFFFLVSTWKCNVACDVINHRVISFRVLLCG